MDNRQEMLWYALDKLRTGFTYERDPKFRRDQFDEGVSLLHHYFLSMSSSPDLGQSPGGLNEDEKK